MTPEELMKPRYKVIADYPQSKIKVGDIYTPPVNDEIDSFWNKYPHLFKQLQWWEERLPEEMPEYVRWLFDERKDSKSMDGYVVKVRGWMQNGYSVLTQQGDVIASQFFAPATESEYNTFIESKK